MHPGPHPTDQLGMTTRLGTSVARSREVEDDFRRQCEAVGSEEISTAPVQPMSVFVGGGRRPLRRNHRHLLFAGDLDGTDGSAQVGCARYESTAPIAKWLAENGDGRARLLHYVESQVRLEDAASIKRPTHFRNFVQAGLEAHSPDDDGYQRHVELALTVAASFVAACGFGDAAVVRFSHTGISGSVGEGLRAGTRRLLAEALERADRAEVSRIARENSLPGDQIDLLDALLSAREVDLCAGIELARRFGRVSAAADLELIERFQHSSALLGLKLRFDGTLHRSLQFYSGLTLQIDLAGQREVAGGGDYSGLVEDYGGPKMRSFGWAFGLDRVLSAMERAHGTSS